MGKALNVLFGTGIEEEIKTVRRRLEKAESNQKILALAARCHPVKYSINWSSQIGDRISVESAASPRYFLIQATN